MSYYDPANTGSDQSTWNDYCGFARIAGTGFSWLNGKFTGQKDNIYSFADFKWFESVGLTYIGESWFDGCSKLGNIVLPSTIKVIGERAFNGCSALQEIELPESVIAIAAHVFDGCTGLNTIMVRSSVPATLGANAFHKHDGLKIYVPADQVNAYKKAWSDYAQYIVGDDTYQINKVVTVTDVGQLAGKLGLKLVKESGKVRYIQGPYAKYDSLTVTGPLNGEDLAVIRHMAGADAYDSDPTDGCLRHLNLWDAQIRKDKDNSYNGNFSDEYIGDDNVVPDYLFENCTAIETVILPQSATFIGENVFEDATALKRVCVGRKTTGYDTDLLQNLNGIEELVFLTEGFATNTSIWNDPWEAPIQQVYAPPSQVGNYLGDLKLTPRAMNICSPFDEESVMWILAGSGHFFPSEYLEMESVEDIFLISDITKFDDFWRFHNVKVLGNTFSDNKELVSITLPNSLERIEAGAFYGCDKLNTIRISCDSVPELAPDAFRSLPHSFKILVPKSLCKLYREKWAQYAEHINPYNIYYAQDDLITVTVTQPNTLAAALGLTITKAHYTGQGGDYLNSLRGDYSRVRRLKVVGPISGADFDVLRHMAGWCPWAQSRNYSGHLEYIDLYDAEIKETAFGVLGYDRSMTTFFKAEDPKLWWFDDNMLPHHAFLRAYSLRTLILPKTCTKVESRALQECEGLETLVIGDDCKDFNWDALDDDAMLTRMYILAKKKVKINTDMAIWRKLCNNYNPTFDAFYVPPSLFAEYLKDDAYTGSSWQRTNDISKGEFDDDASFRYFASHAAATKDDLTQVYSVKGWSKSHEDVKDLSYLRFSAIDSLRAADMQPLTQLERIALPATLEAIEDSVFAKSPNLRYVDMLLCDSAMVIDGLRTGGFSRLGIDSLQTLVYVPQEYGEPGGVNIVVANATGMNAETFRLADDKDYCVPYAFHAGKVENTRKLLKRATPYTICLPYELDVPQYARTYELTERDGNTLTFMEVAPGTKLQALKPYLVKVVGNKRLRKNSTTLNTSIQQTIPAMGGATFGQQVDVAGYSLRGTLSALSNAEAAELGAYILQSDGDWHPVSTTSTGASIPPFRAYLLPSSRNANQSIGMELNDLDEIETIKTIDQDGTERVYDLNGRLVNENYRGIVIKNGKKVINN